VVSRSLPSGVTAPNPVMTTRLVCHAPYSVLPSRQRYSAFSKTTGPAPVTIARPSSPGHPPPHSRPCNRRPAAADPPSRPPVVPDAPESPPPKALDVTSPRFRRHPEGARCHITAVPEAPRRRSMSHHRGSGGTPKALDVTSPAIQWRSMSRRPPSMAPNDASTALGRRSMAHRVRSEPGRAGSHRVRSEPGRAGSHRVRSEPGRADSNRDSPRYGCRSGGQAHAWPAPGPPSTGYPLRIGLAAAPQGSFQQAGDGRQALAGRVVADRAGREAGGLREIADRHSGAFPQCL
jgi:hypothetical protein